MLRVHFAGIVADEVGRLRGKLVDGLDVRGGVRADQLQPQRGLVEMQRRSSAVDHDVVLRTARGVEHAVHELAVVRLERERPVVGFLFGHRGHGRNRQIRKKDTRMRMRSMRLSLNR